ncbi:CRISPR-associated endonuclease Cas2 [Corynebacterium meridianum]|uniref:CRISPR-associated endoribonuclease Cas2 n=1 Tax=Corynebacterium meridianum TaxID=2765363 RepID=A0A934M486_9CORY|nr:CRISPR-associated endonuclease Cas2 [Corynebacterium meridianum]
MPAKGAEQVWCLVMFDLPVKTKVQRAAATRFRNELLDIGFCMMQFSVYVQYLPLAARLSQIGAAVKAALPSGGDVRIICVTDTQWAKALRFSSAVAVKPESEPSQLTIF